MSGGREEQEIICIRFGSSHSSGGEVGNKEIITIEDSDEDELPEPHTESTLGKEVMEKQIGRREEKEMICI